MDIVERLRPIIHDKIAARGLELYDLKVVRAGAHSAVRVYVDKDGGVTIDDCEKLSHELSILLDVEDVFKHPYTLEVSSPGLDRRLDTEKDFNRTVGRNVKFFLHEPVEGKKEILGKVLGAGDGSVRVDIDGREVAVAMSIIQKARIEVSFK